MQPWLNHLNQRGILAELRWNADQRPEIREAIAQRLHPELPADREALQDLTAPPRLYHYSVSISHTHTLGGFLAVPRPSQIGFDVELKSRVRPELVRRICTAEEYAKAHEPELIWSAKEAFFKALEDEQPRVVSELTIADWKKTMDGLWEFKGYGPRNALGVAYADDVYLFAMALIVPE